MKFLVISLFLLLFSFSFGQIKTGKYLPDTLYCLGLSNYFQQEDIYTCISIQGPITRNWLIEFGIGSGWRHNRTRGVSSYTHMVVSFDIVRRPRLFFGPSIRGFHESLNSFNQDDQFQFAGGQLGYRLAYGGRLKVVHSAYLGLHNFTYRTGQHVNNRVYLGYAFQIGFNYEI